MPDELRNDVMAYVGCIAGAISADEFRDGLAAAGFTHVEVVDTGSDLNAYGQIEGQSGCCSPAMSGEACCSSEEPSIVHLELGKLSQKYDLNQYAASVRVYAVR
jgi:hypothetical protein